MRVRDGRTRHFLSFLHSGARGRCKGDPVGRPWCAVALRAQERRTASPPRMAEPHEANVRRVWRV